jgi:hypothetical protein
MKLAQVTINRGQGKKEHIQMFVVSETTSGLFLTEKLDPAGYGLPKAEWMPFNSPAIQCHIIGI